MTEAGLDWNFAFAEKTLLVVCLPYIYAEPNRRRIACVMLVPGRERNRIEKLQNRIGTRLKKIRVRTLLTVQCFFKPCLGVKMTP